jgi:parallel beta-helix repeat protein
VSAAGVLRRALPAAVTAVAIAPVTASFAVPFSAKRSGLTNHLDHVAREAALVETDGLDERQLSGTRVLIMARSGTLADIQRRFPRAVQDRRGVWSVSETIVVSHGATLTVAAPSVRELRLVDTDHSFTDIVGWGSNVRFVGAPHRLLLVRSWDVRTRRSDVSLEDGRGSVQTREGGRIDAAWTDFSNLGFYAGRVSGVAVVSRYGEPRGGGTLVHSTFTGNFFGAYSYNAEAMRFIDDRFTDNIIYGLDPHDNSDDFVVRGNLAAGNGRHGIIFSRFCDRNLIIDNVSERNGWHGIVLDDGKSADGPSNENVVAHNLIRDNGLVGVSIDGSDRNLISDNAIVGGDQGIRVYGPATGDRLEGNTIRRPRSFGILLDHPSSNATVAGNTITGASDGVRIRDAPDSVVANNAIHSAKQHGIKIDGFAGRRSVGVRVIGNSVTGAGPSPFGVQLRHVPGIDVDHNPNAWDYPLAHRLARMLGWFVGPGAWVWLFATVAFGGRWLALRRRVDRRRSAGANDGEQPASTTIPDDVIFEVADRARPNVAIAPRPEARADTAKRHDAMLETPRGWRLDLKRPVGRIIIDGREHSQPAVQLDEAPEPAPVEQPRPPAPDASAHVAAPPARSLLRVAGESGWVAVFVTVLLGGRLAALGERVTRGRLPSRGFSEER